MVGRGMSGVFDMGVSVWWVGECVESMTWGWCMVGRGMCGVNDMGMVYGGSGNVWSL